jgi:hypothetical protein
VRARRARLFALLADRGDDHPLAGRALGPAEAERLYEPEKAPGPTSRRGAKRGARPGRRGPRAPGELRRPFHAAEITPTARR